MKLNLISGESYLLINEKISEITGESKNVTIFDLMVCTLEDVLVEAGYVSMFCDEKYIIVKNANFFGKEALREKEAEVLIKYMECPSDNTTLIFVCNEKVDLRKKIVKMIKDKYNLITIPNLKYYEIENRVRDYFKKNKFEIDMDTVKYIVASGLNNYDLIMNEVEKIMLYYDVAGVVTKRDVSNIIAKNMNTNNFLFVDAVVDNDLNKSMALLSDLKIMKVEPTVLFALLARDFRIMLQIKTLQEQGLMEYAIVNELKLQDWQLEKYLKKIFPYKIKELEEILVKLADMDLNIKRGRLDKNLALELFILDIC